MLSEKENGEQLNCLYLRGTDGGNYSAHRILKVHTSMWGNSINHIYPEVDLISMAAAAVTSSPRRKKEANH